MAASETQLVPSRQQGQGKPPFSLLDLVRNLPWNELSVPIAVLGIIFAMITPLPSFLLDVLISTNITLSVIVLLVSMYIIKPVDFSVFPTTLLLLNLIPSGTEHLFGPADSAQRKFRTSAAGEVIEAFGNFVVGGNYAIGVVIFLVLIAIQYVVINHGAVPHLRGHRQIPSRCPAG